MKLKRTAHDRGDLAKDEDSQIWGELARIRGAEKRPPSEHVAALVPLLKERGVEKILDIGCGHGRDSLFLAREGFIVTGMDKSQEALDVVKKKAEEETLKNVHTLLGEAKKIPAQDSTYDAAIANLVLDLLKMPDRNEALKEIERVLKPGGIASITGNFSREDIRDMRATLKNFNFLTPDDERVAEVGKIQEIIVEKKQ